MKEQSLGLRPTTPVVIETPEGLIKIHRGEKRNHIRVELPDRMVAHIGEDRALATGRFLKRIGDGTLVPSFQCLMPDVKDGVFEGVSPRIVRTVKKDR